MPHVGPRYIVRCTAWSSFGVYDRERLYFVTDAETSTAAQRIADRLSYATPAEREQWLAMFAQAARKAA